MMFPRSRSLRVVPYKLFELVEGAVFEASACPGTELIAEVTIVTPLRRFQYRAVGRADRDGVVRVRVPYATETRAPARPAGPYQLRLSDRAFSVAVSDDDVRKSRLFRLGEFPETEGARCAPSTARVPIVRDVGEQDIPSSVQPE